MQGEKRGGERKHRKGYRKRRKRKDRRKAQGSRVALQSVPENEEMKRGHLQSRDLQFCGDESLYPLQNYIPLWPAWHQRKEISEQRLWTHTAGPLPLSITDQNSSYSRTATVFQKIFSFKKNVHSKIKSCMRVIYLGMFWFLCIIIYV